MFKNPFQVAVAFAVLALIVKLTIFSLGMQHGETENYIFFIYMLLLLLAILFGIKTNKIIYQRVTTFGEDFKTGARTASFFALLVFAITYFYYTQIDADFFPIKQQPYLDGFTELVKTKIAEGVPKEEIVKGLYESTYKVKQQLSPYAHSMLTLFGLVFIGMFNSLLFAFIMKKFPALK